MAIVDFANRLKRPSLLAFLGVLFSQPGGVATSGDWVVTIKTEAITNCLDFPESKLNPVIRARVFLEQGLTELSEEEREMQKRGAIPDEEISSTKFEDIFYSHLHVLGLKRYLPLRLKEGTPGIIRIAPSDSVAKHEEANAAANATVRLFLNLYLHKAALRCVFVPRDIFDTYVAELQRYGFRYETIAPGKIKSALLILSVKSEPAGRAYYMSYGY